MKNDHDTLARVGLCRDMAQMNSLAVEHLMLQESTHEQKLLIEVARKMGLNELADGISEGLK